VLLCATPRIGSARGHCYLCAGTSFCLVSHVSSRHPGLIWQLVRVQESNGVDVVPSSLRNTVPAALRSTRKRHSLMTDQPQTRSTRAHCFVILSQYVTGSNLTLHTLTHWPRLLNSADILETVGDTLKEFFFKRKEIITRFAN
jgi:hypothetical protein